MIIKIGNEDWHEKVASKSFAPYIFRVAELEPVVWAEIKSIFLPALAQ